MLKIMEKFFKNSSGKATEKPIELSMMAQASKKSIKNKERSHDEILRNLPVILLTKLDTKNLNPTTTSAYYSQAQTDNNPATAGGKSLPKKVKPQRWIAIPDDSPRDDPENSFEADLDIDPVVGSNDHVLGQLPEYFQSLAENQSKIIHRLRCCTPAGIHCPSRGDPVTGIVEKCSVAITILTAVYFYEGSIESLKVKPTKTTGWGNMSNLRKGGPGAYHLQKPLSCHRKYVKIPEFETIVNMFHKDTRVQIEPNLLLPGQGSPPHPVSSSSHLFSPTYLSPHHALYIGCFNKKCRSCIANCTKSN